MKRHRHRKAPTSDLVGSIARGEVPAVLPNRTHGTEFDEALVGAIDAGDLEKVTRLLDAGASVNAEVSTFGSWCCGDEFRTPLMAAAEFGRLEIARLLVARGGDPWVRRELREDVGESDYRFVGTGVWETAVDTRPAWPPGGRLEAGHGWHLSQDPAGGLGAGSTVAAAPGTVRSEGMTARGLLDAGA